MAAGKKLGGWLIVLILAAICVLWGVKTNNRMVAAEESVSKAWGNVENAYQRRADLIPNLVETAKGYMAHERETLTAVTEARNVAAAAAKALAAAPGDASASAAFTKAETGLSGVLSRLIAVAERYPELKADGQMSRVMEELSSTENRIAFARQAYNDAVTEYNTKRELFPTSIVAGVFNSAPAALLEATDSAAQREAPQVKF